jgi:hypothetical protein
MCERMEVRAMFRNSHIPRGLSVNAKNSIPRWRRVFMALVLAIIVGSAGQPLPAQAAPASKTDYAYFVFASLDRGNATICVGDNVTISVSAERMLVEGVEFKNKQKMTGMWVEGAVVNPSIGTFITARKLIVWDSDRPNSAVLTFRADKPGKTTLTAKADINYYRTQSGEWVNGPARIAESNPVDVTVEVCNYKVKALSVWDDFGLTHVAMIDQAGMTADSPGHYKGTATVNWVITEDHPQAGCPPAVVTATSQADLTGDMDKDGQQLVVDVAYQLVEATWFTFLEDCTTKSSADQMPYTPAPLTFSVPASGGGHYLNQALVHQLFPVMNISGIAESTVIRVTNP